MTLDEAGECISDAKGALVEGPVVCGIRVHNHVAAYAIRYARRTKSQSNKLGDIGKVLVNLLVTVNAPGIHFRLHLQSDLHMWVSRGQQEEIIVYKYKHTISSASQ